MRILDRNALTWFDDRGAAAFVTAKDPVILGFAKNVAGTILNSGPLGFNKNLQTALAFHTALELSGMQYLVDPRSSYAALSTSSDAVDFLQFPRQTLEYRSGDCDDLSILYSALLEAIGVETAFITIPGHIYIAFSLDLDRWEAEKLFPSGDNIIFRDGKSWIPLEVTELRGGFLKAWDLGMMQWKQHSKENNAGFYPVQEAWSIFEPVGLPGGGDKVPLPAQEEFLDHYQKGLEKLIRREISSREEQLIETIRISQEKPEKVNALGILYARYGLYADAAEQFQSIIDRSSYVPGYINLANVQYLLRNHERSLELFKTAYAMDPESTNALIGILCNGQALGDYTNSDRYFHALEALAPEKAARFSYLFRGGVGSRASETTIRLEEIGWAELKFY